MERRPEIDRRMFVQWSLILAGKLLLENSTGSNSRIISHRAFLPVIDENGNSAQLGHPPQKPERSIANVRGLHDTPNIGGSMDVSLALDDFRRLKATGLTLLNPSPFLLAGSEAMGLEVAVRIYKENNVFDSQCVGAEVGKAFAYLTNPVFQLNNEVNLSEETDGEQVSPREHLEKQFLPAAELVCQIAGSYRSRPRILTTPLAQKAPDVNGLNEEAYFKEFLELLSPHISRLNCDLLLGLHAYIFEEGEDPLEYIKERYLQAREILDRDLPIYVTEGGLHHGERTSYSDEVIAWELERILQTPIPSDLPLRRYNLWVASNYAQRPLEHRLSKNEVLDLYEKATLRRLEGEVSVETPAFRVIENLN